MIYNIDRVLNAMSQILHECLEFDENNAKTGIIVRNPSNQRKDDSYDRSR